jgi:hypothetical protein
MIESLLTGGSRPEEELTSANQLPELNSQNLIDGHDPPGKPLPVLYETFSGQPGPPKELEQCFAFPRSEDESAIFFPELRSKETLPPVVSSKRPSDSIDGTQSAQSPWSKRPRTDEPGHHLKAHFELLLDPLFGDLDDFLERT